MGNAFSTLVLIGIAVIVIIVAAVFLFRSTPPVINNNPTVNPGFLGTPCGTDPNKTVPNVFGSTGICNQGLICLSNNVCAADLGTRCNSLADCSPAATVCSGRCSNEETGGPNELCPCGPLLECVPQPDGFNRCKGQNGAPCVTSDDCISQCINNVCGGGLAEGAPCISQLCAPGLYCDPKGFCQQTGVISGQQNAFCFINNAPLCDTGLNCVDNRCNSSFGGLKANCRAQFCNQPLVCRDIPPIPGSGTTRITNSCLFLDNNLCINNCPGNFNCVTQGLVKKCIGQTGQACIANLNCVSNNCSSISGLLKWTGTTWDNIATPPTDVFIKMLAGPTNVYMLGGTGLWRYDGTTWLLLYGINTTAGRILDFSVSGTIDIIHLLLLTATLDTIVVDASLNPIPNFGTPNGQLIISGNPVTLQNIDFNNFGIIFSNDAAGNVYRNATSLGNFGTQIRAYDASVSTSNNFTVVTAVGVKSQGELGVFTFPIFPEPPIAGQIYDQIANYDTYVEYIVDPSTSQLIPNASASSIYMIASPDGINYQIILNSGNIQTPFPGYVNAGNLIATFADNLYLYTPKVCN